MGWTWITESCLDGYKTKQEYIDSLLFWSYERDGTRYENKVLKSSFVGSSYYAAVEKTSDQANREVWAAVFLTSSKPNASDGCVFGYKDMDETVGPHYYDCPAAILDLLTPTEYEYAKRWREQCRKRASMKGRKLNDGDIIELDEPIKFTDGTASAVFTVRKRMSRGRRQTVLEIEGVSGAYRINGLMTLPWRKLPPKPPAGTFFGDAQ